MNMDVDDVINQLMLLMTNEIAEKNKSVIISFQEKDQLDLGNQFNETFHLSNTTYLEKWTSQYNAFIENTRTEWKFVVLSCYILIVLVSFFGNSIVCKIIFWNSAMRSTTNIFIGNLSISDILMTIFNIPLQLTQILSRNWPLSQFLCKCMPFFQGLSVNVSSFTMACIALDRYQVIAYPLRPRPTMNAIIFKLCLIWIMATIVSSPYPAIAGVEDEFTYKTMTRCRLIYPQTFYLSGMELRLTLTVITMTFQYLGPLLIAGFTYYRICLIIWNRKSIGVVSERQKIQRYMAKWKTIRMLIIVLLVFAVCWLPLNIYHIYQDFRGVVGINKHNPVIFLVCHWFAMSSICYNPFVYCWLNDRFREKAKHFILCKHISTSKLNELQRKKQNKFFSKHSGRMLTITTNTLTKSSRFSFRQIFVKVEQSSNKLEEQVSFTIHKKNSKSDNRNSSTILPEEVDYYLAENIKETEI